MDPKCNEFVDDDSSAVSLTKDTSFTEKGVFVADSDIHSTKTVVVESNCEKERDCVDGEGSHSSSNNSDEEFELKVLSNKEKRAISKRNKKRTHNASLSHKSKKQKRNNYSCLKKQRIMLLFYRNRIKYLTECY